MSILRSLLKRFISSKREPNLAPSDINQKFNLDVQSKDKESYNSTKTQTFLFAISIIGIVYRVSSFLSLIDMYYASCYFKCLSASLDQLIFLIIFKSTCKG